jgi:ribosome-associated protein
VTVSRASDEGGPAGEAPAGQLRVDETREEAPAMRLDDLLKFFGVAGTGGHAKHLIQSGAVAVNGVTETRRKHLIRAGDTVAVGGEAFVVEFERTPEPDAPT